jgi:hypothetical protein
MTIIKIAILLLLQMMIIILSAFLPSALASILSFYYIIIIIIIIIRRRRRRRRRNSKWITHSQSKPPSPIYGGTYRRKTKKGLDESGNKRSDMTLYVLQTSLYRK